MWIQVLALPDKVDSIFGMQRIVITKRYRGSNDPPCSSCSSACGTVGSRILFSMEKAGADVGARGRRTRQEDVARQQHHPQPSTSRETSGHAKSSNHHAASLFVPFRALGLISEGGAAFAMQRRGKETFVVTSVGTSWQIYNAASLRVRLIGPDVTRVLPSGGRSDEDDTQVISALACRGDLTFAAVGGYVVECKRVHRTGIYRVGSVDDVNIDASSARILQLRVLGPLLVGLSGEGVHVWEIGTYGIPRREMFIQDKNFRPTCMAHPQTYLNKILVGSADGRVRLLNIVSGKTIYEFASLESGVETIVASPAVDVVAVGLLDGRVLLRDVRRDATMLELKNASGAGARASSFLSKSIDEIRFRSMESSCSTVAFDGGALMATGGTAGVISVWNLETQTVHAIIRDAHDGPLSHMEFLEGQPVLVSTADDNSIKEWIFDGTDGQPRLLRYRSGHAAPPTIVRHYADSTRLLSGGQDRAFRYFSTVQDAQSREMSQGHVTRRAKKLKISEQELKLGRITGLDACDVRERDWSNVITAHENDPVAYVWRIQRFAQGEFALSPPPRANADANGDEDNMPVSSVCLSRCGNFGFVGTEGGRIDRYNMQSGLHRGTYRTPEGFSAHCGAVTGLAADACNRNLVSGGLDGMLKCWNLKTRAMQGEMDLGSKIGRIAFHPTTCLVAVACDDGIIRLCDVEARTVVRRFKGHTDRITDLQFSADCRWLLSSGMDGTLRIWDVPDYRSPTGEMSPHFILSNMHGDELRELLSTSYHYLDVYHLTRHRAHTTRSGSTILQVLKMESPITSLSLAPAMDVLVTTHVERRGIYAWANELIFGALESITASAKPIVARLPVSSSEQRRLEEAGGGRGGIRSGMLVHSALHDVRAEDAKGAEDDDSDDESLSLSLDLSEDSDDVDDVDGVEDAETPCEKTEDDYDENAMSLAAPTISARDQQVLAGKAPVAPAMITMSMLPRSQWLNMIHIDSIKTRNKPIEPPKKPEAAPFFLPTATGVNAGRDPVFMSEEDHERVRKAAAAAWGDEEDESVGGEEGEDCRGEQNGMATVAQADPHVTRVRTVNGKGASNAANGTDTGNLPDSLASLLDAYQANKTWRPVLGYIKSIAPSKLDVQLRSLDEFEFDYARSDEADRESYDDEEDDLHAGSRESWHRIRTFMLFLADAISSSTDFEFLQALLRAFILIHGDIVIKHKALKDIAEIIERKTAASWNRIRGKLQRTQCIVGLLQNNHC